MSEKVKIVTIQELRFLGAITPFHPPSPHFTPKYFYTRVKQGVMHPAFFTFLYTFFLLLQNPLKTSDKRYKTTFVIESTRSSTKVTNRTSGLLGVVPIPIQHVIIVRTHGPIVHRHPLHHSIRSKDQILHLQSGAVTMNLVLPIL